MTLKISAGPAPTGVRPRLGFAVQLCGLRFLRFVPDDLAATPAEVTARLAEQVGVTPPRALGRYAGEVDGRLGCVYQPLSR